MKITKASTIAKRLLKFFGPNGKRWAKGAMAKDRNGRPFSTVNSPKAVRFCLSGALQKLNLPEQPIASALANKGFYSGVVAFNDSHYFSSIKRVLQEIAAA